MVDRKSEETIESVKLCWEFNSKKTLERNDDEWMKMEEMVHN